MRYVVTDRFFDMLSALYAVAIEDENQLEIALVSSLLMDTEKGQDLA